MTLMPRESGHQIAMLSKNVFLQELGIKNITYVILEDLKNRRINTNNFSQFQFHPSPEDHGAVDWIFVLDTLNYSFWSKSDSPKWTVNGQTGYFALCASIKRAMDEGKPIIDPKYYSRITRCDAEQIFRGDNTATIPLLDERIKSLREAGKILLENYQGTFTECIKLCSGSAEKLLKLIVNEFVSYQDEADYQNLRVSFYKRAQILVADIWTCFNGEGIGEFHDIDYITAFADYRIPQVLLHFGVLRYSSGLLYRLQCDEELENGGDDEIEIRGCSIRAVELMKEELRYLIGRDPNLNLEKTDVNEISIDHYLWNYRRDHAAELDRIPFHKTRCIYY
ncbi:queuosine salvage protein isoform X1 [Hylaeus volcanicus]|uniref:queuosine salvage protein isoform X1 n=1 Tax=Hylaeus volcanicus TaxID=313075 RepID=UPI0023B78FFE|nr:queuosine salvage protein isoform X1 [Hylaeus volcanicus]